MTIQTKKDNIFDELPKEAYICQKALWYKDIRICIDHIDNDLDKPLDYHKAAKALLRKLQSEKEGCTK